LYQELIAEIGTMVSRPRTPVAATALARVPSYDLPIIADLPVVQSATAGLPSARYALARPFSQSMTAFPPSTSALPPTSGQPSERVVPSMSTLRTA
jgi:hypothetical protein